MLHGEEEYVKQYEINSSRVALGETSLTNVALYGLITSMQAQKRFDIAEVSAVPAPRRTLGCCCLR